MTIIYSVLVAVLAILFNEHKVCSLEEEIIPLCSTRSCVAVPPIQAPKPVNMTIKVESQTARVFAATTQITVSLVRIQSVRSYCHNVPFAERGAECRNTVFSESLSDSEVRGIVDTGGCWVGRDCSQPDRDSACTQYMYDRSPCLNPVRDRRIGPTSLYWPPHGRFAFQWTCTMSWSCEIIPFKVTPVLNLEDDGHTAFVSIPKGKVSVATDNTEHVKALQDGWYLHTQPIKLDEGALYVAPVS